MNRSTHCSRRSATVAAVALLAGSGTALGVTPAWAAGHNITVVHTNDIVAVEGYGSGQHKVEVLRGGQVVATEVAMPYDLDTRTPGVQGPGLELNHGTDGTPLPGECWSRPTDVRPGDTVRVTVGDRTDEVKVHDISLEERQVTADHVVIRGIAKTADGAVIPPGSLDNNEFRNANGGKFRAEPVGPPEAWAEHVGGFQMTYLKTAFDRNRDNLDPAARARALETEDGYATGIGHFDGATQSQFVEGFAPNPAVVGEPYPMVVGDGCANPATPPGDGGGGTTPPPGGGGGGTPPGGGGGTTPPPGGGGGTPPAKDVAPTVSVTPTHKATGVARKADVTAKFSEAVSGVSSGTFRLYRVRSNGTRERVSAVIQYKASNWTATLNPKRRLAAKAKYEVHLTNGIKDTDGSTKHRLATKKTTFTTGG